MTPGERLATRLKAARTELGISQFALGVAAGIDEATAKSRVSHYELAISVPTLPTLKNLALALGKPMSWFFCEDDELELLSVLGGMSEVERRETLAIIGEELKSRTTETR